ncbi:inhibitor of apoptosis protein-like isoform X2 [Littorina saxatilis]|uniref:inhibitor of apoptosis protein-like isoform X2 n=1 Tax=Littorina saxatilis TaxID=31220 RepID=UPI0038B57110
MRLLLFCILLILPVFLIFVPVHVADNDTLQQHCENYASFDTYFVDLCRETPGNHCQNSVLSNSSVLNKEQDCMEDDTVHLLLKAALLPYLTLFCAVLGYEERDLLNDPLEKIRPQIYVCFMFIVILHIFCLYTTLLENLPCKTKLDDPEDSDKLSLEHVRLVKDSEKWEPTSLGELGLTMKDPAFGKPRGRKHGAGDPFPHAFNKSTIDHLFNFRRDQSFRQTCTARPASVSLASHFASGTYGQPGSSQQLQKEGVRLASFKDFPTSVSVSVIRLAQAGFFYTGERDMVRCFSCGVTHDCWQVGDRPTLVHARISPNCPLVRGSDTSNLSLPLPVTNRPSFPEPGSIDSGYGSHSYGSSSGAPSANTGAPSANASVTSGSATYRGEEMQADCDAVTDSLASGPQALGASSMSATSAMVSTAAANVPIASSLATPENSVYSGAPLYGIATPMDGGAPRNLPMPTKRLDLGGAVYPLYSQMDARKRSFSNWVEDQGLPAVDELITLGFFYAGYADCVRCFFCGIGLKSWEPGDIPAEVHARWRPTCEYLRLVKGDEFVDQVANGGRNVAGRGGLNQSGTNPAIQNHSGNGGAQDHVRRDVAVPQPGTAPVDAPSQGLNPEVPDIPVVRRARETGYTDQQIADGIAKLRLIGMERAIEVMLVEVLTNLFRDNPPQRQQQQDDVGNNGSNSTGGGNVSRSDSVAPGNDADLQGDGDQPGLEVPDNAAQNGADNPLGDRQNVLQQENARLRNMRTCQRCHEQPVGVIFLPCGHIIACTTCAPNIRRCLRCDTVIRATANVYFS